MSNSGTTSSNDSKIKEDMNSTSNINDIKEGMNSTSKNNEIKEGMKSSSNNNDMNEEHVMVFVAYDGNWELDGKEWLFKESKGSMIVVSKYVTLSEITHKLCEKFEVQDNYGLKLEFCYRVGFPIMEIECDEDLSLFISKSSKTELLLCVTVVPKDDVSRGVEEDEINQEIGEESPHGQINTEIKEESPHVRKDDQLVENILFRATRRSDWLKAREIVNTNEVTWTSKINARGDTALHKAVGINKNNEVVREILKEINSELLATTVDTYGQNPAHRAAFYGNTEALKMMLESNPNCLFTPDYSVDLPIHSALIVPEIKTFLYLFKQMKSNYKVEYDKLFRGTHGPRLLHRVIDVGLIDVAYELINNFPSLAATVHEDKTALEHVLRKPELYYSGTSYSFCSRFVYQIVPIENNSLGTTDAADAENQETPKKDKLVTRHTSRCLHDVISWICVKLWVTTLLLGKHKLPPN